MADEITFGWESGKTLKAKVYSPDGTQVETTDVTLTEIGSTGLYVGDSDSISYGDLVIVYDDDSDINVGWGEYKPQKILNIYNET